MLEVPEAIAEFVRTECWTWIGPQTSGGYGAIKVDGTMFRAHRYVYELLVGPIPEGLTIDHLCRNRLCVRPDHLEPVTMRENLLRGNTFQRANSRKRECKNGHPFDEENTYIHGPSKHYPYGRRSCRACDRERRQRRRALAQAWRDVS